MRHTGFTAVLIAVLVLAVRITSATAAGGSGPSPTISWASDAPQAPSHLHGRPGVLPIHPQALARAKQAANEHASLGGPAGEGSGGGSSYAPAFNGQQDSQVTPPDTTGAIGPSSYIELVNLRYGIYDRSGNVVAQGPLSDLTAISNSCLSDPQIIWDADGARFFYSVLDTCDDTFAFGFSKGSSPIAANAAQWCQYTAFQYGADLPDFPKLGDSADFLMIGTNVFQPSLFTYTYLRSDVDWIAKADLVLGSDGSCPNPGSIHAGAFVGVKNADGTDASTPVPANGVEFVSPTGYVVAGPDASSSPGGSASSLTLFQVTKDAVSGSAVLSAPTTVSVPSYSVPADAPQPRTKKRLDTSDARLTQAVAAFDPSKGRVAVWTQHTVFGGTGAQVRWYEIAGDTGALLDSGKVTSSSLYAFNAAISPDRAVAGPTQASFGGSMALTFNTSSTNAYTAIQLVTKPVGGSQSGFVKIVQSPGKDVDFSCSSVCRWGDYAGASPDPNGQGGSGTVWLANQWNVKSLTGSNVDWRTSVFSVTP